MQAVSTTNKLYCNVLALQKGLDPIGSAQPFTDLIVIETPLPWKRNIYQEAGAQPQQVIDLMRLWLERYRAGQGYPHGALMVAPDAAYSVKGHRRVMYYARAKGAFAQFSKVEYIVPEVEAGELVWALFEARHELPRFECYRDTRHDSTRDFLVCTHGTVDVACAKFGYPLYNFLRQLEIEGMRTWRVSHFGGHVFAPTMMEMPTGHFWAYVEAAQAEQIAKRCGDVRDLYGHYRGWAGVDGGFLQAFERELWMRYGWEWFKYVKTGCVLAQDSADEPTWAEVQISFSAPNSVQQSTFTAHVKVKNNILTPHSTEDSHEYPYPQYVVTRI